MTLSSSQQERQKQQEEEIQAGLDFLLSHFSSPLFPRTISSEKTEDSQIPVSSREEALTYYRKSEFKDCKINAFYYSKLEETTIGGLFWHPDLIFIDLDLQDFKSEKALQFALAKTLKNIADKLGSNSAVPTVLHSGGGYHVIQPVDCPVPLESIQDVKEFREIPNPSEIFLRFAKEFLSNGKADKKNNPSFKSCMLRIPGSINSRRNGKKVRIIQRWNGYMPRITKELIIEFQRYLIQKKIHKKIEQEKIDRERQARRKQLPAGYNMNYYEWIEKLLDTGIEDCRKTCVGLILAPYLIHVKGLSFETSRQIIKNWLQKCDSLRKLDRGFDSRIRDALRSSQSNQIGPMSREKIKVDSTYNTLLNLLVSKGVLN